MGKKLSIIGLMQCKDGIERKLGTSGDAGMSSYLIAAAAAILVSLHTRGEWPLGTRDTKSSDEKFANVLKCEFCSKCPIAKQQKSPTISSFGFIFGTIFGREKLLR